MAQRITVHAHFYQPPRENPWTGTIDEQPSAAPFMDWNERVNRDCYHPNAFSHIPSPDGDITVNNFERLSFNVGPTLLAWLQTADPETYARILEADRASIERLGHGNAMAQAYHHTILPLSSARDIRTQVRWGLADFRHRFGRDAEGLWLPETAADDTTLGILIEEGVVFTILAPHQAAEPIDATLPFLYEHPDGSGRTLTLFLYDGDISQAIAFENAGSSAAKFLSLFEANLSDGCHLVHAATDGETYGHHHRFSDLGLAYALFVEADDRALEVTNYGAFLAACPAHEKVKLAKGATSWSCSHGVGRWMQDCGCSTGGEPGWNQRWRAPLRAALEIVRDAADEAFERLGRELFHDPWAARDRYIQVALGADPDEFVAQEGSGPSGEQLRAAAVLFELQRNAMAMFTSCGWFFNDISGIETVQVLRYAKRTLELLDAVGGPDPETAFLATLDQAHSNDPSAGTGADVYRSL